MKERYLLEDGGDNSFWELGLPLKVRTGFWTLGREKGW